jgi:NAD(P)-dependent dehydrogenase (short-subunit alcohol dehydrogenase family)
MDLHLKGKLALVSGSTAGIGHAIAATLAHEGARVIINGRSQTSVDDVVGAPAEHSHRRLLGIRRSRERLGLASVGIAAGAGCGEVAAVGQPAWADLVGCSRPSSQLRPVGDAVTEPDDGGCAVALPEGCSTTALAGGGSTTRYPSGA